MNTKNFKKSEIARLNALREIYLRINNNEHFTAKEICGKYKIANVFVQCAVKDGILKNQSEIIGYPKFKISTYKWNSEIQPNIHMIRRIMKTEQEYWRQKNERILIKNSFKKQHLTIKKCRTCGVEKDISEFYKEKGRADGHSADCKKCTIKRTSSRRRILIDGKIEYIDLKNNIVNEQNVIKKEKGVKNQNDKLGIIRRFLKWLWCIVPLLFIQ